MRSIAGLRWPVVVYITMAIAACVGAYSEMPVLEFLGISFLCGGVGVAAHELKTICISHEEYEALQARRAAEHELEMRLAKTPPVEGC